MNQWDDAKFVAAVKGRRRKVQDQSWMGAEKTLRTRAGIRMVLMVRPIDMPFRSAKIQ